MIWCQLYRSVPSFFFFFHLLLWWEGGRSAKWHINGPPPINQLIEDWKPTTSGWWFPATAVFLYVTALSDSFAVPYSIGGGLPFGGISLNHCQFYPAHMVFLPRIMNIAKERVLQSPLHHSHIGERGRDASGTDTPGIFRDHSAPALAGSIVLPSLGYHRTRHPRSPMSIFLLVMPYTTTSRPPQRWPTQR